MRSARVLFATLHDTHDWLRLKMTPIARLTSESNGITGLARWQRADGPEGVMPPLISGIAPPSDF